MPALQHTPVAYAELYVQSAFSTPNDLVQVPESVMSKVVSITHREGLEQTGMPIMQELQIRIADPLLEFSNPADADMMSRPPFNRYQYRNIFGKGKWIIAKLGWAHDFGDVFSGEILTITPSFPVTGPPQSVIIAHDRSEHFKGSSKRAGEILNKAQMLFTEEVREERGAIGVPYHRLLSVIAANMAAEEFAFYKSSTLTKGRELTFLPNINAPEFQALVDIREYVAGVQESWFVTLRNFARMAGCVVYFEDRNLVVETLENMGRSVWKRTLYWREVPLITEEYGILDSAEFGYIDKESRVIEGISSNDKSLYSVREDRAPGGTINVQLVANATTGAIEQVQTHNTKEGLVRSAGKQ